MPGRRVCLREGGEQDTAVGHARLTAATLRLQHGQAMNRDADAAAGCPATAGGSTLPNGVDGARLDEEEEEEEDDEELEPACLEEGGPLSAPSDGGAPRFCIATVQLRSAAARSSRSGYPGGLQIPLRP